MPSPEATLFDIARLRQHRFAYESEKQAYGTNRPLAEYEQLLYDNLGKKLTKHISDVHPDGRFSLLDIGCGSGIALAQLARRYPNARFAGVTAHDYREQLVGKENRRLLTDVVDYKVADAQNLKNVFPGEKFDIITSVWCFPYIADKPNALRQVYKALSPQGVALIYRSGIALSYQDTERLNSFWKNQGIEAEFSESQDPYDARSITLKKTRDVKLPMPFSYRSYRYDAEVYLKDSAGDSRKPNQ